LTYANVMATLGVFLALAGGATAATLITGRQIKDGSIAAKDLSAQLRAKIAAHARAGTPGVAGPPGPAGAIGPGGLAVQGAPGPPGPFYDTDKLVLFNFAEGTPPALPPLQATPDQTVVQGTFSMPMAGKIEASGGGGFGGTCQAAPCTYVVGLYLDGQPVAASAQKINVTSTGGGPCPALGPWYPGARIPDVPAGIHSLTVGVSYLSGGTIDSLDACRRTMRVTGPYG
jgi:hypothetical protein